MRRVLLPFVVVAATGLVGEAIGRISDVRRPIPAPPGTSVVVSGIVRDAATRLPIEHALVRVPRKPFVTVTDAEGRYRLVLPPQLGSHRIAFASQDSRRQEATLFFHEATEHRFDVHLAEHMSVTGRAFDEATGRGVAGSTIREENGVAQLAISGENGEFSFPWSRDLHCSFRIEHPDYCATRWSVSGPHFAPALDLRVPLTTPHVVELTVIGPDEKPVESGYAGVEAWMPTRSGEESDSPGRGSILSPKTFAKVDANGPARLRIPPSPYPLTVEAVARSTATDFGSRIWESVALDAREPGARSIVTIEMPARPRIRGRIHDARGPVRGRVLLSSRSNRWHEIGADLKDGAFDFEYAPNGVLDLFVSESKFHEGDPCFHTGIESSDVTTRELELAYSPCESSVEGRLLAADGTPLARKTIELQRERFADDFRMWHSRRAETDDHGRFSVQAVDHARYRLTLRSSSIHAAPTDVAAPAIDVAMIAVPRFERKLRILDPTTGASLAGGQSVLVDVHWRPTGAIRFERSTGNSDPNGDVMIALPGGRVDLVVVVDSWPNGDAYRENYAPTPIPALLLPDEPGTDPIVIALEKGAEIEIGIDTSIDLQSFYGTEERRFWLVPLRDLTEQGIDPEAFPFDRLDREHGVRRQFPSARAIASFGFKGFANVVNVLPEPHALITFPPDRRINPRIVDPRETPVSVLIQP